MDMWKRVPVLHALLNETSKVLLDDLGPGIVVNSRRSAVCRLAQRRTNRADGDPELLQRQTYLFLLVYRRWRVTDSQMGGWM
jgi:hypothetical protein